MKTYEIMFLFEPTAGANWATVESEINRLMERAEAEVIVTTRLGERRLAYEIAGCKRGLYVLTYFKVMGDRIAGIERDARLSEMILRVLILSANGLSEEKMRNATLGGMAQEPKPAKAEQATPTPGQDAQETDGMKAQSSETTPSPELVGSTIEESETSRS